MFTVKIIKSDCFELSDDPDDFYAGPDRNDVTLEGVDCSVDEFVRCFMFTGEGENFCTLVNDDDVAVGMTDIGGSSLNLNAGSFITVTFDDWLNGYLKMQTIWNKNKTNKLCAAAISRLEDMYNEAIKDLNLVIDKPSIHSPDTDLFLTLGGLNE